MKDSADTNQCAFNQILMESFISAIKRINSYEIAPNVVVVGEILDNRVVSGVPSK